MIWPGASIALPPDGDQPFERAGSGRSLLRHSDEEEHSSSMRALAVIAATALLLAACQSKRETCALWRGDQIDNAEAIKRLGLKPDTYWTFVESYCEFYKS